MQMRTSIFLLTHCISLVLSEFQGLDQKAVHTFICPEEHQSLTDNVLNFHKRDQRAAKPDDLKTTITETAKSSLQTNTTYKVVCYYFSSAQYRAGIGQFTPSDIDPQLCTHVVYGHAFLDPDLLIIKPSDKWTDIDNGLYTKVTDLKKRGLKVSIAIGGWMDSAGDKYSRLVHSPTSRRRFIEHLLHFIYQHNFDGLELDWEFPKCWQLECDSGPDSDQDTFATLVKELHRAFKPLGLLLSATVPSAKNPIDVGYNVPVMSENLDWVTVRTLDYHGPWEKKTGHSSPLYAKPDDDGYKFSVNFTIRYLISQGADSRKLILAIPMYGNTFTLNSSDDNGLNAHSKGPGERGEHSNSPGILSYYEICDRIQNKGWVVVRDLEDIGSYAQKGDQWVAFDEPVMVQRKAKYVTHNNLGGVMIFSLDYDDFRNHCRGGKYPLLQAINTVLRPSSDPDRDVPSSTEKDQTTKHETVGSTPPSQSKVVCYFTNWSWYREGLGKYTPLNIDSSLCTHIVYAFASLDPQSLTVRSKDQWADVDNDFYRQVTKLNKSGLKVLLALGGWEDSQDDKYSRLVNSPAARKRFVSHLLEFLQRYNFDGVSLHWEYPTCWHYDCTTGPATDKEGFAALVTQLSQELKPRGMLISSIVATSKLVVEKAYDLESLAEHLDWVELKTLDYHGSWEKRTGHVSPLYYAAGDNSPITNVNFSVQYWLTTGFPKEKLILGLPTYGNSFTLESASKVNLGVSTTGPGNAGPNTGSPGTLAYYEICEMVRTEGWKVEKPSYGTVAYHNTQWISYDDVSDIDRKTQFIKNLGLGGTMVWTLDYDDFNNNCGCGNYPLLRAVNRGLRGFSTFNNCTLPS
ncbi:probable chitinase 10 isoform X2 [Macrosteles quadrilineatus]|uniref:probable chitinase 10 isoform X2 n=1 Tax=Macrosteles quadrilineatus TaxID=74068 RepID=UPI0023E1ACD1|nr:probable chitinase 10 isoform X2 [Macrosteles quadrilineatus]